LMEMIEWLKSHIMCLKATLNSSSPTRRTSKRCRDERPM
jgi:hypothetical protein